MQGKKQQVELDMKNQTGSKQEKEYIKAVYCPPASLTYMQSISCKMPGWMKHKLGSRLLGEGVCYKLPTSTGSLKKQESSRKTSISALSTMPKPLTVWITINLKIPKEMGIADHLICLLRNLYAGQEATKEYVKAVYCHPAYLTSMQSTS